MRILKATEKKNSPSDDTGLQDSDFQLSSYIGCYKLNATQTQNPPLQNPWMPHQLPPLPLRGGYT